MPGLRLSGGVPQTLSAPPAYLHPHPLSAALPDNLPNAACPQAVNSASEQVVGSLPPEVREGVVAASKGAVALASEVARHPAEAALVTGLVAGPLLLNWYNARCAHGGTVQVQGIAWISSR